MSALVDHANHRSTEGEEVTRSGVQRPWHQTPFPGASHLAAHGNHVSGVVHVFTRVVDEVIQALLLMPVRVGRGSCVRISWPNNAHADPMRDQAGTDATHLQLVVLVVVIHLGNVINEATPGEGRFNQGGSWVKAITAHPTPSTAPCLART